MKLGNLAQRLLFGFVAGPVFLWATWYGGWARFLQLGFVVVAGAWEAARLVRRRYPESLLGELLIPLSVFGSLLITEGGPFEGPSLLPTIWAVTLLALVLVGFQRFSREQAFSWIALNGAVLAFFTYAGRAIFALASWNHAPGEGGWMVVAPLLWAALGCWAGDTGAYTVGKLWGKHKLCPELSPAKTIEGAAGALLATAVFSFFWAQSLLHWQAGMAILMGLVLAVLGILGDLLESSAKRWAGVKDSSQIFPGHGGVYDRFDSLFLSAPAVWAILVAIR